MTLTESVARGKTAEYRPGVGGRCRHRNRAHRGVHRLRPDVCRLPGASARPQDQPRTSAASLGAGVVESRTADVGVVIVAVPPTSIPDVVGHALRTYPAAAVTDVGSVKAGVLHTLWERDMPSRARRLSPMAGSQHSGPMTAGPLRGPGWVITPCAVRCRRPTRLAPGGAGVPARGRHGRR